MKSRNILLALGLLAGSVMTHAELVVVVNPKVTISRLSQSQLLGLFLGKSLEFPDGSVALPVNVEGDRRAQFYQKILKKPPAQMEKYWARMIFMGTATPPREINVKRLKETVAETTGAISYMERREVDPSVKVLKITR